MFPSCQIHFLVVALQSGEKITKYPASMKPRIFLLYIQHLRRKTFINILQLYINIQLQYVYQYISYKLYNIYHTRCTLYKICKKYVNDTEIISFYLGGWGMTLQSDWKITQLLAWSQVVDIQVLAQEQYVQYSDEGSCGKQYCKLFILFQSLHSWSY